MRAGIFAAVPTPIDATGAVDDAAFDRLIDFLAGSGLDGVCVGGATGEYPLFDVREREALIRRAAARLPDGQRLLVGIGAGALAQTLALGVSAFAAGAEAVLVPAPFFFRYGQPDLDAFFRRVGDALGGRCLLYDLPTFTTPIETATIIDLLRSDAHYIGLKDSSGRASRLAELARARGAEAWSLFVGDDILLRQGVAAGWNGGISGLAAFCPELLLQLYRSAAGGSENEAARCDALLAELIGRIGACPVPWAVRAGLRARDLDIGSPPLPLSPGRRDDLRRFEDWLRASFIPRAAAAAS